MAINEGARSGLDLLHKLITFTLFYQILTEMHKTLCNNDACHDTSEYGVRVMMV